MKGLTLEERDDTDGDEAQMMGARVRSSQFGSGLKTPCESEEKEAADYSSDATDAHINE